MNAKSCAAIALLFAMMPLQVSAGRFGGGGGRFAGGRRGRVRLSRRGGGASTQHVRSLEHWARGDEPDDHRERYQQRVRSVDDGEQRKL
jgi:hypothetical protein